MGARGTAKKAKQALQGKAKGAVQPEGTGERQPQKKVARAVPLNYQAIMASRGVREDEARKMAEQLAESRNEAQVLVVALDIRQSTTFMLHVEDFYRYADTIARFIVYLKHSCIAKGGWFDKFTGDGAIIFWTFEGTLNAGLLRTVLTYCANVQRSFIVGFMPMLRATAGCVPESYGLSIGVDYGKCLLTDLRPSSAFEIDGVEVGTTPTINSVTVLGRAVVGAVRMVSEAKAHQILWNENPGEFLYRLRHKISPQVSVRRVLVHNKDLGGNQFAYEFRDARLDQPLKEFFRPDEGSTL